MAIRGRTRGLSEIEFAGQDGRAYALVTVPAGPLRALHFEPSSRRWHLPAISRSLPSRETATARFPSPSFANAKVLPYSSVDT